MARAAKVKTIQVKSGRGGYIVALAVGSLATVASGLVVVGAVLLLPTLLMLLIERLPGRPMCRAMALFGIAVSVSMLLDLWSQGGGMVAGLAALTDILVVGRAWAAQAFAWLLAELIPVLLVFQADFSATRELRRLRESRQTLLDEWARDHT